jgi:hypothetical protein
MRKLNYPLFPLAGCFVPLLEDERVGIPAVLLRRAIRSLVDAVMALYSAST